MAGPLVISVIKRYPNDTLRCVAKTGSGECVPSSPLSTPDRDSLQWPLCYFFEKIVSCEYIDTHLCVCVWGGFVEMEMCDYVGQSYIVPRMK